MDALMLATLNALWQGTALVGLVMLALRSGLRRNATTACVVWSVTFVIVAALPAIDLALARPPAVRSPVVSPPALVTVRVVASGHAERPNTMQRLARQPIAAVSDRIASPQRVASAVTPPAPAGLALERAGALATELGDVASRFSRAWGLAVAAAWSLVAAMLLFRLGLAYAAVVRVKRSATPLDDSLIAARLRAAGHRRRATVATSAAVEIPCAIGFRRPMILIPASLVASLDHDDLARVVLHESAHLQRFDDCINALEQIVCALQFFQPALFFARRRIDFEREVACDDRVLEDSGDPLRYAECLARIVQRQVRGRQAAVVPGFVLRRAQVVARVRRIVDRSRDASPHLRFGALALGGALIVAGTGIARLQVPLVAPVAAQTVTPTPPAAPARVRPARPAVVRAIVLDGDEPTPSTVKVRVTTPSAVLPRVRVRPVTAATPRVIVIRAVRSVLRPAPHTVTLPPIDVPRFAPVGGNVAAVRGPRVRSFIVVENDEPPMRITIPKIKVVVPQVQVHVNVADVVAANPVVRRDDLLSAIDDAKYPHPSVDELIALKNHGVSASLVRAMGALGSNRPSIAQLVQLSDQGIDAAYYAAMQRYLAQPPTIDQMIGLRMQGVSARWLEGFAAAGYPKLGIDDAATLVQQGISGSYVRGLTDAGLKSLTPAQLVDLHNHGVDASFVRRLYEHGYRNLSVDDLIRLKDSGL